MQLSTRANNSSDFGNLWLLYALRVPAALLKLKQPSNSSTAWVQVRVQGQEKHACPLHNSLFTDTQ